MALEITKAAVLGAGVMGSGIASHLAGAGLEVFLLDIVPNELTKEEKEKGLAPDSPEVRNRFALKGLETALRARPPAFFDKEDAGKIRCGNYEDDSGWIGEADWICEVVVENLGIKKAVFENVARRRRPGSIVTSNTSGLFVSQLAEGMPEEMRRSFFVTHFFNPVRTMHLLELVPGRDTDLARMEEFAGWAERRLGKGIVRGKDTPNFVANRIGVYYIMDAIKRMQEMGLGIETVDAILGPPSGKPRSAVFRTLDMVGIDTFVHVADTVYDGAPEDEERQVFKPPKLFHDMVEKGWLGDKSGRTGFYKSVKTEGGGKDILKLDVAKMEHAPQEKRKFKSIGKARDIEDPGKRIKKLVGEEDEAARYAWLVLSDVLCYSARRIGEIADDIVSIDSGMKWGYGWELGPFETWDALGVKEAAGRLAKEGREVPPVVTEVTRNGDGVFYKWEGGQKMFWDTGSKGYLPIRTSPGVLLLRSFKERDMVVHKTPSASLLDIGDGVLLLEFHSKLNTIDVDTSLAAEKAFEKLQEWGWAGLVIGNEDPAFFSAGANLLLVMMAIGQKDWKQLETLVRGFQNLNMRFRSCPRPVVSAPFGMALGGGMEMTLHAAGVQACAELSMGLVEANVGVIPAGGGTKELLFRSIEACARQGMKGQLPGIAKAFENIITARVTASAREAFQLAYLDERTDSISMNRDLLIGDAKQKVLGMARSYTPGRPRTLALPGPGGKEPLDYSIEQMRQKKMLSDYDTVIAGKIAWVLTGGDIAQGEEVTEQKLLDLECEAFCSLCGEQKTVDRISHTLSTGKPLKN